MSRSYTPFQLHLLFFSTPTTPPRLTFLSALRASVSLGLDVPVALFLSLSLRLLYAPYPDFWAPIIVDKIPQSAHRTQLSTASLPKDKTEFSCGDLLRLLGAGSGNGWLKHKIDQGHIVGFWTMAADAQTHTVNKDDVQRFQQGEWEKDVIARRRDRNDVLPLWRGGPVWVTGHSYVVGKMLGITVYSEKRE